ncbi:MAG: response regulator [Planctomycetes bacterium]|nr:response regulator [Planctomycetota bacterium]
MFKSKKKTQQAKILIVDDEPDYLSAVQYHLGWSNYEIITAVNGKEALEKAESEKPDLILLDTSMPVMDGHEVLEQLSKNPELKQIPVIMVTARCEVQDIATASSYSVADYVAKPFDFAELTKKIESALTKNSALSK